MQLIIVILTNIVSTLLIFQMIMELQNNDQVCHSLLTSKPKNNH